MTAQQDLRVMVGYFVEVCRRKGLKVNACKSRMMATNEEEGLKYEVSVNEVQLEHLLEFKYLGCILDESGRVSGRKVAGAGRSLVNTRGL